MSYTPTIIILKKDLDKHRDLFLCGDWQYEGTKEYKKDGMTKGGEEGQTIMEYIKYVYENHKRFTIAGIELVLCKPSFSKFNESIRNKLIELKIEYAESN